jgi:hypothetical protein
MRKSTVLRGRRRKRAVVGKAHRAKSLLQFLRESPLAGLELNLERDKDEGREIELLLAT